eukprot:s754_g6.t3
MTKCSESLPAFTALQPFWGSTSCKFIGRKSTDRLAMEESTWTLSSMLSWISLTSCSCDTTTVHSISSCVNNVVWACLVL